MMLWMRLVYAVGGIVGAILTGVFYSDEIIKAANVALAPTFAGQLWVQVEGVLATMVYSGIATFIILKVIDLIIDFVLIPMMNVWVWT